MFRKRTSGAPGLVVIGKAPLEVASKLRFALILILQSKLSQILF